MQRSSTSIYTHTYKSAFRALVLLLLPESNIMSSQSLAHPLAQVSTAGNRPLANFHPNVWGDQFIAYTHEDEVRHACKEKQLNDLKGEIRGKLVNASGSTNQQLKFIDEVQRLGVAYHFEREIGQALQQIYDIYLDGGDVEGDLFSVALKFRLLRQSGYNISCGTFKKFVDEKGSFKKDLISNVQGMLSLYEASYLRVHGEDILDEALAFTTTHLKSMVEHLEYPLAELVAHALEQPIRKGIERLEARWYITIYQDETSHDKTLLKLAKLDFNLVQTQHKEELSIINRWWKEWDFTTKLPFIRDRLVEGYFWIVGAYFEPQYLRARRILTKVIVMTSVIDDIYDAYGTFEELALFTEAIERWDAHSIDHLPEYMQLCYVAMLDVYKEIEEEMEKEGYQYRVPYAIEEMKKLVRAYFKEAKWLNEDRVPSVEEYMSVALVSSGYSLLTTISFIGMGEIVEKEAMDWVTSGPKIIAASTVVVRLMDDIVSHEFEQKRHHVPSGIECYMKQHGVSEEVVRHEFRKQVVNAWKDINQGLLRPTAIPMALLMRVLNLTRVMDVLYKESDQYTHVGKEMLKNIAFVLIDPII